MWSPIKLTGITLFSANFGRTQPLNPRIFLIMRHTFLWDNPGRSRDHPHKMGFGNLCNLCGCFEAAL